MEKKRTLEVIINFISKKKCKFKSDPFYNILSKYSQIENLLKLNIISTIKYIYFSNKKVHIILYDEEEFINVKSEDEIKANLSFYFYLNLLIVENIDIINYTYSFDFIVQINNIQRNINDKYTKILYSKIIIDLIKNYKHLDEYNEEKEKNLLEKIKTENQDIIKNSLTIFARINLLIDGKDVYNKKIDELLSDIIKSLIINEKLENDEIISFMDLENIDITETMFNSLYKILDNNSGYINKYIIKNKKDLLNDKNINFYYILLKYIIKNSIYIYQIPLLLELRQLVLNLIKSKEVLYNGLDEDKINKLEFIILILTDSEYYLNKSKNENKLTEVLKYYKDFKFISKKEEINILQDIINNNKNGFEIYVLDYEVAKKINIRAPIIKYLINSKEPEILNNENKIKEYIESWNYYENFIKMKKFRKIRKDARHLLKQYFKEEKNKNILLKIFDQDKISSFINNNNRKLVNKEEDGKKKDGRKYYQKINNESNLYNNEIDINRTEEKNSELNETGNQSEVGDNKKENEELNNNNINNINNNDFLLNISQKFTISFHLNEKGKEPFLTYDKIFIGDKYITISEECMMKNNESNEYIEKNGKNILVLNHKNFLEILKKIEDIIRNEFKDDYKLEITLGFKKDTKSSLYNISFNYLFKETIEGEIDRINDENLLVNGENSENLDFQYLLLEINSSKYPNNKSNQLKIKSKETLSNSIKDIPITGQKHFIDLQKSIIATSKIIEFIKVAGKNENYPFFIKELGNGNYIIVDFLKNKIVYDAYFNKKESNIKINDYCYKSNINFKIICSKNKISEIVKIDKKELNSIKSKNNPLKSNVNKVSYEDESSLLFDNENINPYEIRNNSLEEDLISNIDKMPEEEKSIRNISVLISDYIKNGIFLQNNLRDNNLFEEYFYDTKNFEIYSICPLLIVENSNKKKNLDNIDVNEEYRKNNTNDETDFFLVGGFDNDEKEGKIKVFRIQYGDNLWKTKIIFEEDINIPNNNGLLGPITKIIQSRISGNILATSLNGNVYIFSKPKIIKINQ